MSVTPASLIDKYVRLHSEGTEPTWDELINGEHDGEFTDEDKAALWLAFDEYETRCNQAYKLVGDMWVETWKARGNKGLQVGDYLVGASKTRTDEKCVDTFGVLSWLVDNPLFIPVVVAPNALKKASFPPAVRETFYEKVKVYKPEAQPAAIPVEVLERNRSKT